jgi:hypothetical protein
LKQEWTIYRNWQQWVRKTQDEDKLIKGKQEWTIYRNWQQWVHKTQDEDKLIKGKQEWTIYRNWQQWIHKTIFLAKKVTEIKFFIVDYGYEILLTTLYLMKV